MALHLFVPRLHPLAAAALTCLLSACAGLAPPAVPATAATATAPAAAVAASPAAAASGGKSAAPAAAPAAPGTPPAFATVIKDARKTEGLLTIWQKDDKFWFELRPQDFDKPLLLSPKIAGGIGEGMLFGGLMVGRWQPWGRAQLVEFRRVHNMVQLVARNEEFTAPAGTPEARAVQAAFSDSLLGSTAVASQAHPDSKAVLVEANALFVSDMLGLGISLQRQYRQNYSFDGRNSAITEARASGDELMLKVQAHYASPSLSFPQPGTPPGMPAPSLPSSLPDVRSLFLGLHYSLLRLPEQPMAPRQADPRLGHFTTLVQDFGNDQRRSPRQRYINRWRLEKKDPTAALSEPVQPITYWLDRNIPLKYRDTITRGVLEWNKAFERIGFRNAVVVQQQADDASFDTLDARVASIRWMTNAQPAFGAVGPSQVDPRSGEILDADIGIESLSSRNQRAARSQILAPQAMADWPALMQAGGERDHAPAHAAEAACHFADQTAEQLGYALDLLDARGELDPDSPEAEAFVQAYLFDVTMHEVGHTLGLRHNFRSSRIYSEAQLSDPQFTREHGLAGSVMEYAPINLAREGQTAGQAFQTTLGPYDHWAVEFAYKPLAAAEEKAELQRMAARSAEPLLAYGTDEDNSLGYDPETLVFDLGNDPVAFAKKRLDIARELIGRQAVRPLKPTEDYSVLRRAVSYALRDAGRAAGVLARQVGGLRTVRDFPGTGRDPLQPVPVAVQREALKALLRGVLAAEGLQVSPALARKLAVDFMDRGESNDAAGTDFSVEAMVLDMQRALLNILMSDTLASRLLDAEGKADRPADAMPLAEVYSQLSDAVWADGGGDIAGPRRELQRDHLNRLASLMLRPAPGSRADARGLMRAEARRLLARLQAAEHRAGLSAAGRAHLTDSLETLRSALAAPMQRSGV